jgi:glutathione S-transferase
MSLTFYYSPMSSATRIHWALEELGIPYDKVKLDLAAGDQKKPEYLALNPNGKVPLIVDDGLPIFESLAILLYLGERYGVDKGLFPAATQARAEAFKWLAWGSVSIHDAIARLIHTAGDRFPEEKNAKGAETAKNDLATLLGILERHLTGREYILGAAFSLADVSLATWMPFLGRLGVDLNPYQQLNAWSARCMARPALARAMVG